MSAVHSDVGICLLSKQELFVLTCRVIKNVRGRLECTDAAKRIMEFIPLVTAERLHVSLARYVNYHRDLRIYINPGATAEELGEHLLENGYMIWKAADSEEAMPSSQDHIVLTCHVHRHMFTWRHMWAFEI